jgi:hypothetical protein
VGRGKAHSHRSFRLAVLVFYVRAAQSVEVVQALLILVLDGQEKARALGKVNGLK